MAVDYTRLPVNTIQGINTELTKIQEAFNDALSRTSSTTNFMDTDLDMNNERILNLPKPVSDVEPVRVKDIDEYVQGVQGATVFTTEAEGFPSPDVYSLGTPLLFTDTYKEYVLVLSSDNVKMWLEKGNVGDEVPVTAASHLTLAQAQASDLRVGQYVRIVDRGMSLFVVRPVGMVTNGYDVVGISGGLSLEYVVNGPVDPLHLGCIGDGITDNSAPLQRALDLAERGEIKFTGDNTFYIADNVDVRSNTNIVGAGATLKLGGHQAVMRVWGVGFVNIEKLNIDGNLLEWTAFSQYTLPIVGCNNVTVEKCHIYNGQNAGIGVGQQLAPIYNFNIKLIYNHIHNIGMADHPNFTSYGNGIAVTGGKDILIHGNTIHDIHQVGFINCEGTFLENIKISKNICYNSTGRAAGIKCYSSGVDVPSKNILVEGNTLYNIGNVGDPDAANTEPAIWIEAGDGVRVINNDVLDCPSVGKAGVISVTADAISVVQGNNIRGCDGGRMEVFSARDIKVLDNTIECPATTTLASNQAALYVESFSTGIGTCRVVGNTIREAPYASIIFNPRSKGILTENMIVHPNRRGGNYAIEETFVGGGFSYSTIGGNTIVDDGNSNQAIAFYNFSSGDTVDMIYKSDSWDVADTFVRYDMGSVVRYIQSDEPLIQASVPIPTVGYNRRGRILYTANPTVGSPNYAVCVASGTPGTWQLGPAL